MSDCLTDNEVLAYVAGQGEDPVFLAHIDDCSKCRTLVACAVENRDSAVWTPSAAGPRETTIKIGAVVAGRYEIRRFLGRGGMGEVYEARDKELGDLVALKTLAMTALDDAKAVTRLKAEVQLARRVAHPNVCRIFDFGVHEIRRADRDTERLPFLTMELLSGQTLGQRLRQRGPMRDAEARALVEQIVAGLAEVHRVGIIHRDLKSENVFLAQSEAGERVVLMDFGLARAAPAPDLSSVSLTYGLVGTVAYMSPEQLQNRPLGPQSDIYALGVVMYEVVTGKLPFRGATPFDLAIERLRQLPASPSTVNPAVTRAWAQTIMKCLAIDQAGRFQRAPDILVALKSWQPSRPTRWRVALGASTVTALVTIAALWLHRPLRRGTEDLPPIPAIAPAPSAVLPQPVPSPQPVDAMDSAHTADRPAVRGNEKAAVQVRAQPQVAPSPQHVGRSRRKVASAVGEHSAATAPPVPPAAEPSTGDSLPTPGPDPAVNGEAEKEHARAAKDPADRIFNPFAPGGKAR